MRTQHGSQFHGLTILKLLKNKKIYEFLNYFRQKFSKLPIFNIKPLKFIWKCEFSIGIFNYEQFYCRFSQHRFISSAMWLLWIKGKCSKICRADALRKLSGQYPDYQSWHVWGQGSDWTKSPGLTWAAYKRFYVKCFL